MKLDKKVLLRYLHICEERRNRFFDSGNYNGDSIKKMRLCSYWHGKAKVVEMLLLQFCKK